MRGLEFLTIAVVVLAALNLVRFRRIRLEIERLDAASAAAEQRLQSRQQWFEAIVQHATDVICLLDGDGRITWISPSAAHVLGYADTDAVGMQFVDFVHPDDRELVLAAFDEGRRRPGPAAPVEFRIRHEDGSWRHFETLATNMLDDPNVGAIITNSRDISERVHATELVAHRALHDPLTGLANRQLLFDRMDHALLRAKRSGRAVAALYLDIDDFKSVNDQYGHASGDRVLQVVGERLQSCTRPGDTIARMGGDEFVVVAEDIDAASVALALAERIRAALDEPLKIGLRSVVASVSIGIAVDRGTTTSDLLLHDADAALYRAKALGKDRCELFDSTLREESVRRMSVELLLRQALEQGDLVVHYQPIVDLSTSSLHAVEALLRLERPTGELVTPNEFLAVAEDTGLIVTIGAGVLDLACGQLASWRIAFGERAPARVGINLSARQLAHPTLLTQVCRVLSDTALAPSMLTLEFTEAAARHMPGRARDVIDELRAMGVQVGIDDFGTGASSLTSLKLLPIDFVKLDRAVVAELGQTGDTAIARAVVDLARSLGLVTVAEGVEREEQVAALRDMGCQLAQGYYFAPPQPAAVVEHTLFTASNVT